MGKSRKIKLQSFVVVLAGEIVSYCTKEEAGDLEILEELPEGATEEAAKELQRLKAEELGKSYQY